jgi:hypothetical protein
LEVIASRENIHHPPRRMREGKSAIFIPETAVDPFREMKPDEIHAAP